MATISSRFECRNFVTAKTSSKEVRTVLVATHIRLEKGRIARLRPVECSIEVPRMREAGAGTGAENCFRARWHLLLCIGAACSD
ncbi:hypothetical protein Mp_5g05760 [Marchantia polymorpha subsp. ruderalis]|uniref:Uncharacterized protein n=1 Tax=Marchantia polymorpha subsp. ruderalis TaxID=1480154 RepID=A0AAF6BFB9_MARPO|nr:hypothetical protein Mp_5g05760 [Marchantia polymorpha subsp. ruderalis]